MTIQKLKFTSLSLIIVAVSVIQNSESTISLAPKSIGVKRWLSNAIRPDIGTLPVHFNILNSPIVDVSTFNNLPPRDVPY